MSDSNPEYKGPGRPRKKVPPVKWHVHVPMDLSAFHYAILTDPVTGKVPMGALSSLIERLLRDEARRLGAKGL